MKDLSIFGSDGDKSKYHIIMILSWLRESLDGLDLSAIGYGVNRYHNEKNAIP
jgi:hypothetical protein